MTNVSWGNPGTSSGWSTTANWTGLVGGELYPGQSPGDTVTIGGTNGAYVVTFDVSTATISSLSIEGGNGANHVTTLRMMGGTLNITGGATFLKKDSPAALDGAGTISVGSGGITATGPVGSEGAITAGTATTGGVLDLTGTGFITSPFVFAIGTAAATTLDFDLAGGVIAPTAITINNVNQTLEIGPSGSVIIQTTQNVTNGTILMAGGGHHGLQWHLIRLLDIKRIAERLRHGKRRADQVRERHCEHNRGGRRQPYFDHRHRLQLRASVHHRQHRYIRSGTRQHAWSRKQLYVRGISRRTGAYRQRGERVRRHNRRP